MEETQQQLLKEPYNPTDPVVVFDPEYNNGAVIKLYDNPDTKGNSSQFSSVSAVKDDAINIPVVKMNNIILKDNQIDFLKIFYEGFLPTINLTVKDEDNLVRTLDTPGFDNDIQIVITAEINGYYKKINLKFFITKITPLDDYITYEAVFKFPELRKDILKQIGKGKGKLNTYNTLLEIAKEVKLGFAATPKCEDIQDNQYRLCMSQKYIDFIKEQLSFGGLDEESIFDAWVDLFGYLVMVNVPYVMNEKLESEQLMIYSMVGEHSELPTSGEVSGIQLQRTLTNNKMNETNYNLLFSTYETIINNNMIYNNGALNENFIMTHDNGEAKIETEQVQIIENSLDGVAQCQDYEYKKTQFLGVEFDTEMPILQKTQINTKYFEKLRSRKLKITLDKYNLGLERGTLVNVLIKEYNQDVIKTLSGNKDMEETASGMMNPYVSGIYYIDSQEFEYKTEDHKIWQTLYLIKRGDVTTPINKTIMPVHNEETK